MAADHDHDHGHDHGLIDDLARIEALRTEGVHRAGDHEGPFSLHVLGLGKTGADVITSIVKNPPEGFLSARRHEVRRRWRSTSATRTSPRSARRPSALPADKSYVNTVAMPVPTHADLSYALNRYREFLKMEYPRYYWNPNYEPWLPADVEIASSDGHFSRAVAKAIYGAEYYQDREIAGALDEFATEIMASEATPLVVVAFSLAGGVGSGIVVEIARHLSSIKLGRRPWVIGLGVLPNGADPAEYRDGSLFPVINELDCMIDTEKNKGVMAVWGDLYKNPFTGGFFMVDQDDVQALTGDLAATHAYVDAGVGTFLAGNASGDLYETLKALNWLAVPADAWHPAIRGEQGDRWIRHARRCARRATSTRSARSAWSRASPPSTSRPGSSAATSTTTTTKKITDAVSRGRERQGRTRGAVRRGRQRPGQRRHPAGEQARPRRVRPGPRPLRHPRVGRQAAHPLLAARPRRDALRAVDPFRRHGRRVHLGLRLLGGRPPRRHPGRGGRSGRRGGHRGHRRRPEPVAPFVTG